MYKKRLQAILKQKNPKKVSAVDTILSKYRGREHAVYCKVCQKYGITPKPEWIPAQVDSSKSNNKDKDVIKNKLKQMKKQMASKKSDRQSIKQPIKPSSTKPKPKSRSKVPTKPTIPTKSISQSSQMKNKLAALKSKRLSKTNSITKVRQPPKNIMKQVPSKVIVSKKAVIEKAEQSEDEYEDDFEVLLTSLYQQHFDCIT